LICLVHNRSLLKYEVKDCVKEGNVEDHKID